MPNAKACRGVIYTYNNRISGSRFTSANINISLNSSTLCLRWYILLFIISNTLFEINKSFSSSLSMCLGMFNQVEVHFYGLRII